MDYILRSDRNKEENEETKQALVTEYLEVSGFLIMCFLIELVLNVVDFKVQRTDAFYRPRGEDR